METDPMKGGLKDARVRRLVLYDTTSKHSRTERLVFWGFKKETSTYRPA